MKIYVNGQVVECISTNLLQLHKELQLPSVVAIAVENKIIQKSEWERTSLVEGEHIVIVKMAFGG